MKEVSCHALRPLFSAADEKGLDYSRVLVGIPYDLSYLRNKNERIEWSVYCRIISNLRQYFSAQDFEDMGINSVKERQIFTVLFVIGFGFVKPRKILIQQALKGGQDIFNCIGYKADFVSPTRAKITLTLEDGYEFCREFFLITKGVWYQSGALSKRDFKSNFTWTDRGAIYDLSWGRANFFSRLRRIIRWGFIFQKALSEYNDANEALMSKYNELEESKRVLERQAALLRTAHEIAKSIRQSRAIDTTLRAITDVLVKEGKFSFAKIRLQKDIEGKEFRIEASHGKERQTTPVASRQIVINEETIGDLMVDPEVHVDPGEMDELLGYLVPIISISVHDALVLRAVTDYRDNLELRVGQRTLELREAEDELLKTISLLRKAQESQNHFFANISHEFRTPLTLILGPVKQIAERTEDEKTRDELAIVHRNARKVLTLVNQLLDISKIESGNMKLQASPRDIIRLLKNLVVSFTPYAERKRITLKFTTTESAIPAFVDKEKFESIVTNVLSNAFKFTPEAGLIELSVFRDDHRANIRISDTGIGIPKDKLPRIFDRFYQVDGTHTREQEGTGIGLALTKELVDLHKGTIAVESVEGKGTVVTVSIPLGKKHLRPEEIVQQPESHEDEAVEELASVSTEKPHQSGLIDKVRTDSDRHIVLLVEDNSDVRYYIRENIENDYCLLETADGEEGWFKATECLPDIVVSDVMMPKMDGFQLCKKLKTDERTSHIPVILLTAKAATQDKIEGFETGADAYILKPFEPEELKARIKNLIEQRKRLHEHFRKHGVLGIDDSRLISIDKRFLDKIFHIIADNISDASFGVESLAEMAAVSRSVLHRKIVSLLGEPPVDLIRRLRLMRAAELIEKKFGNMSEIAFEVGFTNPSYFSECFKKQFGTSPSQFPSQDGNK